MPSTTRTAHQPSAARRGRNPRYPFVPIIKHVENCPAPGFAVARNRTQQVKGFAFASREEAVAYAQRYIDANWKTEASS